MNRRGFFLSALAGAGVTAISLKAGRAIAQETQGTPPIATFATDLPGGRLFVRAYQAPGQGRYWVMARRDGRDRWFQVSLPRAAGPMLRTAAQDGELIGDMRVGSNLLQFEIQRLMGGDDYSFRMRTPDDEVFNGSGTRSGPEDDDTPTGGGGGGTQALGFFGALVAIVAIICATVIAGMAMGYESDFNIQTRGGFDITFDVTQVPNEPDGDGFMHDPSCDLMPPINC